MRTLHLHLLDARSVPLPEAAGLSPESWARYQQMTSDKRRQQFLVGRQLLARVAGLLCGQQFPMAAVTEGPRGPVLRDRPELCLSLAHSGDCLGAVADLAPCGLDIERVFARRDMHALAGFALPATEVHWVEAQASLALDRFYLLWTLREASFKAGLRSSVFGGDSLVLDNEIQAPFAWDSRSECGYRITLAAAQPFTCQVHWSGQG